LQDFLHSKRAAAWHGSFHCIASITQDLPVSELSVLFAKAQQKLISPVGFVLNTKKQNSNSSQTMVEKDLKVQGRFYFFPSPNPDELLQRSN